MNDIIHIIKVCFIQFHYAFWTLLEGRIDNSDIVWLRVHVLCSCFYSLGFNSAIFAVGINIAKINTQWTLNIYYSRVRWSRWYADIYTREVVPGTKTRTLIPAELNNCTVRPYVQGEKRMIGIDIFFTNFCNPHIV